MNDIVRLTKIFDFETAHALFGYDGKCKNIHGHSYKLYLTIKGQPNSDKSDPKYGMLMDFGDLKRIVNETIVNEWDHAILLNENSPHLSLGQHLREEGHKVILTPYQPTCENMLLDIVNRIPSLLPKNVELIEAKLHETDNSYCEWQKADQI